MLFDRISNDRHPSATHMAMFESIAPPELLVRYILHLTEQLENDTNPSIPMMQRVQRLIATFGS